MEASTKRTTPEEVMALVRELLVEEFDIEPELVTESATMEELDLDSLDMVEIATVAEQRYGVRIRASDAEGITDLGGVVELIARKSNEGDLEAVEAGGAAEEGVLAEAAVDVPAGEREGS